LIAARLALMTFALLLAGGCASQETGFAITDATVINPRAANVTEDMTVVVRNGRIATVQSATAPLPRAVRTIDGRGGYLIPGLWDAHVHLSKLGSNSLALFVANGVTGVRDMGSNLPELMVWRTDIEAGRLVGPLIMVSGSMIESRENLDRMRNSGGVEAADRQRIGVGDPEEGRAAVRTLADAGINQIKMRTSPDIETFIAVSEEAGRRNLPFAAHALFAPEEILAAGLDSVEHYLVLPPLELSGVGEEERRTLFSRMAAARLHMSNTAINFQGLTTPYETGLAILDNGAEHNDPLRKYVCGYLIDDWREQLEESRVAQYEALLPLLPIFYREQREMFEEGVPLLAGTDSAVMFVYPGFSLHDELELMATDMGFAPMDVLRIATNGVPAYWDRESQMGGIEPGQLADLVLLNANPLEDISNTRRIRGVLTQGQWRDRAALDQLLLDVEEDSKSDCNRGSNAGRRKE
jgi:imidazolonepropionase-like amidohydrolase